MSPEQISTLSNIYRHTSPLLTMYHLILKIHLVTIIYTTAMEVDLLFWFQSCSIFLVFLYCIMYLFFLCLYLCVGLCNSSIFCWFFVIVSICSVPVCMCSSFVYICFVVLYSVSQKKFMKKIKMGSGTPCSRPLCICEDFGVALWGVTLLLWNCERITISQ